MKKVLSVLSVVIFIIYALGERYSFLPLLTDAFLAALLIVYLNMENKRRILLPVIYIILMLTSTFESKGMNIIKALSDTFFLLPLIPEGKRKEKRREIIVVLLLSLLSYIALRRTEERYYYIYYRIESYGKLIALFNIIFLLTVLASLLRCVMKTERNYYSLFLLVFSLLFTIKLNTDYDFLFPYALYDIYIIFIYIVGMKKEIIKIEKRKIVFSNLLPVEIVHLKKKERERVYEIPPNLPKDDREEDI